MLLPQNAFSLNFGVYAFYFLIKWRLTLAQKPSLLLLLVTYNQIFSLFCRPFYCRKLRSERHRSVFAAVLARHASAARSVRAALSGHALSAHLLQAPRPRHRTHRAPHASLPWPALDRKRAAPPGLRRPCQDRWQRQPQPQDHPQQVCSYASKSRLSSTYNDSYFVITYIYPF